MDWHVGNQLAERNVRHHVVEAAVTVGVGIALVIAASVAAAVVGLVIDDGVVVAQVGGRYGGRTVVRRVHVLTDAVAFNQTEWLGRSRIGD